jgi:hypothetical protein
MTAALDVSARAAIVLDGVEWVVEHAEPQHGRLVLVSAGWQRIRVTFRVPLGHPACRPSGPSVVAWRTSS